jgi:hypothetical protein
MTPEQQQLVLQIVSQLDRDAVTGDIWEQRCMYCNGATEGYSDSYGFVHSNYCIVPLVEQLRETMRKNCQ